MTEASWAGLKLIQIKVLPRKGSLQKETNVICYPQLGNNSINRNSLSGVILFISFFIHSMHGYQAASTPNNKTQFSDPGQVSVLSREGDKLYTHTHTYICQVVIRYE